LCGVAGDSQAAGSSPAVGQSGEREVQAQESQVPAAESSLPDIWLVPNGTGIKM